MGTRFEVLAELDETVAKTCVELAVNVTAELIERTPVDTGWARANWIPSLGAPSTAGGTATGGGADTIAQESGQAEVLGFKLEHEAIYVTNNAPYIGRLNDGWSDQAPAGFVEAAIDKVVSEAAR